ncbi:hypothetical protein B0F90DRAFT_1723778 [Multifurca ochricompacta]|uniref:Autophagy-related protein 27 n=1 Tax=Multifurca ochricompacta TaxID=376703 RepID=A0AAD4QND3_9AGAM|nr:hypothetical protein B0F90DRAFT_1723778 [Multifurca ochricompacta]
MVMMTFLFVLVLALMVEIGVVVASSKPWDSPMNQCRITIDHFLFDLCPLFKQRHSSGQVDLVLHCETPPTITTIVYNISLSGPLQKSDAIPDDEQCADGTWACMTKREHHPGRDPLKDSGGAQVIPIITEASQSDSRLGSSSAGDRENFGIRAELREMGVNRLPSLSLQMNGGYYVDMPQRVQINFECAESDEDVLSLSGERNSTHIFTWVTKHACARMYSALSEENEESDSPPADEETNDPSPDAGELPTNQDLRFPPVTPNRNGWATITILVCSGSALLGVGYLAIHPPAVLRRHIRAIRRARSLRGISEAKLLRWAAEDFEMLGDDYEVDEMVNSRPLPDEQISEERIPLRASPTRLTLANYGTAR